MAKESKLRGLKDNGNRQEYTNGDKKLYDRDAVPKGLDEHVWSLTLLFEQCAEMEGFATVGRPIVYTELYHRIAADSDFAELLVVDDPSLTTRTRTGGICGTKVTAITILEYMIVEYWNMSIFDYNHSINDFCSIRVFHYLKQYTIDTFIREELVANGTRIPISKVDIKPSRRTEKDKISAAIDNKTYTEQEYKDKIERWKRDHNNTPEE